MEKKAKKNSNFSKKLTDKYRLVILNESTFEERFSFKLNRLNVFVLGTLFSIFLIIATTFIIAYSPLKEYIPGYSSSKLKKEASNLVYKIDSLQKVIQVNNVYFDNIKEVLAGKITAPTIDKDSILNTFKVHLDTVNFTPSDADLALRNKVEQSDRYSLFEQATKGLDIVFFNPLIGQISKPFNSKEKHFAVDINATKGSPVKAVAKGTVIFSDWTAETGYVMIIEHPKGFTSVYKYNASLLKQQGDFVKGGEAIAIVGSKNKLSKEPLLHFELWNESNPINPAKFIAFE